MNIYLCYKILIKSVVIVFFLGGILLSVAVIREPNNSFRKSLLKVPFFSQLIKERNRTYTKAKFVELSEKTPSLEYLIKFIFEVDRSRPENLRDYLPYYRLISDYFPETAEAYAMIGYCHYYLGEMDLAKEAFLKARDLNRDYFWFSFDLAVIYLRMNDTKEADFYIQEASQLDSDQFQKSIEFMKNSEIFKQILSRVNGVSEEYLRKNLLLGYELMNDSKKMKTASLQLQLF